MDSMSRSRRALEAGSGGKIVRTRRTAAATGARTPYDRPTPTAAPPNPPHEINPNWLSRLIYFPTRSIVSGARKVLSAVFRSDSSSEYSSEDGSDDEEYDGDYIYSREDNGLKEKSDGRRRYELRVKEMVLALLSESDLELTDDVIELIVNKTMLEADVNGDEKIDQDEWKEYVAKHPSLIQNMTLPYLKRKHLTRPRLRRGRWNTPRTWMSTTRNKSQAEGDNIADEEESDKSKSEVNDEDDDESGGEDEDDDE